MLDLEPIKARHAAATRLKWELLYEEPGSEDEAFDGMPAVGVGYYVPELDEFTAIVSLPIVTLPDDADDDNSTNDLTFIAAAHADIPALIAEVERLRAVVDKQLTLLDEVTMLNTETQAELDEVYETLGKANDTIAAYELRDACQPAPLVSSMVSNQ